MLRAAMTPRRSLLVLLFVVACGPSGRQGGIATGTCDPGKKRTCYGGLEQTVDVGPCHTGQQLCGSNALWGPCDNQVVPSQELCGDGVDNNCNGMIDENADLDG